MTHVEIALRLGLATVIGLALGLDREIRGGAAGIRTHALVAMSSAAITVSALMLYEDTRGQPGGDMDPLRVVQGLAQAIGFVAAGSIFVSRGNVRNLTSAANIWLAAALGIAAGAGQFALVLIGAAYGLAIITVVRLAERHIPGSVKAQRRRAWARRAAGGGEDAGSGPGESEGGTLRRERGTSKPPVDDGAGAGRDGGEDPND